MPRAIESLTHWKFYEYSVFFFILRWICFLKRFLGQLLHYTSQLLTFTRQELLKNFIWIGIHSLENQTRVMLFLESEFFCLKHGQVLLPWQQFVCQSKYDSLRSFYLRTINKGRLKIIISNFAFSPQRLNGALNASKSERLPFRLESTIGCKEWSNVMRMSFEHSLILVCLYVFVIELR